MGTLVAVVKYLSVFIGIVLSLAGCQSVPPLPFAEAGGPVLNTGSLLFAGTDGELYATTGTDTIIRVTDGPGRRGADVVISAYAWAGSNIVYATQESSATRGLTGALYAVVPGESSRTLLRRRGFAPFFLYPTPDSTRVGYLGNEADVAGLVMGSITLTGRDDILHGRGQPFYSAWSPDSSMLMTHVGPPVGPSGSLMQIQSVADIVSGEATASPLALSAGRFQAPAYSPDGETIAVVLNEGRRDAVAAVHPTTGDIRLIAPVSGSAAMGWSPDGAQLAFVDGTSAGSGGIAGKLWLTTVAGRDVKLVSERAAAFFWSPDSSKIVFFEPYVIGLGRGATLIYRVGLYRMFDDESELLAIMQPAEAFVRQIVPFFDQYLRAYTIWSPDSRVIALNSAAADGTPVIHLVDTEKLRSGQQFNVSYRLPAQSRPDSGLITGEGIDSRILGFGTVPFFSHSDVGLGNRDFPASLLLYPGIDS